MNLVVLTEERCHFTPCRASVNGRELDDASLYFVNEIFKTTLSWGLSGIPGAPHEEEVFSAY